MNIKKISILTLLILSMSITNVTAEDIYEWRYTTFNTSQSSNIYTEGYYNNWTAWPYCDKAGIDVFDDGDSYTQSYWWGMLMRTYRMSDQQYNSLYKNIDYTDIDYLKIYYQTYLDYEDIGFKVLIDNENVFEKILPHVGWITINVTGYTGIQKTHMVSWNENSRTFKGNQIQAVNLAYIIPEPEPTEKHPYNFTEGQNIIGDSLHYEDGSDYTLIADFELITNILIVIMMCIVAQTFFTFLKYIRMVK